jgi:hypothetical protein
MRILAMTLAALICTSVTAVATSAMGVPVQERLVQR